MGMKREANKAALTAALREALTAVNDIPVEDMGGTCNLDSPVVVLPRWREDDVIAAAHAAGVRAHKTTWGYMFGGYASWQAKNRTVKAEMFARVMSERGYHSFVYYAMD